MTNLKSVRRLFQNGGPESKLELIDGRLIVGNSLRGSRLMLWALLKGWSPRAALAFAPLEAWKASLQRVFEPAPGDESWIERFAEPQIEEAGDVRFSWDHYHAATILTMALHSTGKRGYLSLGRDCAVKLGNDVFTPDVQIIGADAAPRMEYNYLDGPPSVAIEIALKGHEAADVDLKRNYYERGGVPEYWIVDTKRRRIELLRLSNGAYRSQNPDTDGIYRPSSVPGLTFDLNRFWKAWSAERKDMHSALELQQSIFQYAPTGPRVRFPDESDDGPQWGCVPFNPRVEASSTPIRFDEFVAWCGRAKFEMIDGKPLIDGTHGSRNVLGMLLMTFGLDETVRLLHPREWIAAISEEEVWRAREPERRAEWLGYARQAAAILREKFGVKKIALLGGLEDARPLHFWSEIRFILREDPKDREHTMYDSVSKIAPEIIADIREERHCSRADREHLKISALEI